MAILKIARMGNPVLREVAQPVADPCAPAVHALVRDMVETMIDAGGAGLAAPQVHVPLRIVIFRLPESPAPEGRAYDRSSLGAVRVLVNPEITPIGTEREWGWEGCLSLPGLRGIVPRHRAIRYRATGLDGVTIETEAAGFHARVVQHECDHLDGTLYPMRMTDLRLLGFVEEWDRHPLPLDQDVESGGAASTSKSRDPEAGDPKTGERTAMEGEAG